MMRVARSVPWRTGAVLSCLALVMLALAPTKPAAAETIGAASKVEGTATATNNAATRTLEVAAPVLKDDQLATAEKSRLEVTFNDGTMLTMGEGATVKVSQFVYQQDGQSNALQVLAVGAFKLVSGAINKPDKDAVQVITPIGALAVRGTDFWAGPIDGQYGVLLLNGQVTVTTNAGSATLTEAGTGTNITDINSAPGPIRTWPQEKATRALATVAFTQ